MTEGTSEIKLVIRCKKNPAKHAKKLRLQGLSRAAAEEFAGLICGTSRWYIHKPGPDSPIGRCVNCGGELTWEIEEMERENGKA